MSYTNQMRRVIIYLFTVLSLIACDDIVNVEDISNDVVNILAPTNNALVNDTTLLFSWEALADAETYQIQIVTPTFNEAVQILQDTIVTTTSLLTNLEANSYEWRIKAENANYQTGYTTQSFTLEE